MTSGADGIERELIQQRDFLVVREPAYARLLELFEEAVRGELGERLAAVWKYREFNAWYERPLLLLAALRYEALCERGAHPLNDAVAEMPPRAEAATAEALAAAVAPDRARFFRALGERAVQTNETSRAVTWLWPAHLLAAAGELRPLALVDLGASAGLNLIADELPEIWSDASGRPIGMMPRPKVEMRLGLDIAPLDVLDTDQATWLRACVWPSDGARLSRLEQGISRFRTSAARDDGPRLEVCALPDAPARLEALPGDRLVLCMQSIVRDYMSAPDRGRFERGMRDFLLRRPPLSALWSELELQTGGATTEYPAAITVRFVDGAGVARELVLAHAHPHPNRLRLEPEAITAFQAAFQSQHE